MTESEIEAAAQSDPDWEGLLDFDWQSAEVVIPGKKVPISIRVDVDVLAYFKELGAGYQRRMNAVLRSYMLQSQRSEARGLRRAKKTAE
ncbi:MAG: BrnA antitoxin family protein [Pseudomonadota bacterium]